MTIVYRTKTYIAEDWGGDKNAVEQLRAWNDSKKWNLSFADTHDITQSRDGSLNCSIRSSLPTRKDSSKTFIMIVGSKIKGRRAGECTYCSNYDNGMCKTGDNVSNDSVIEYEYKKAVLDRENIKLMHQLQTKAYEYSDEFEPLNWLSQIVIFSIELIGVFPCTR